MVFLEIFADLGYNYLHKMQSDLIEKFRWSLQTLNNSVNRTPVLKVVKQFFFFFASEMKAGWLYITLLVYIRSFFYLAFLVCGFVDWKSVSGLIAKLAALPQSWRVRLVTAVLAACCCFLVIFDSSRTLRSLCPFCSLDVFSLGGFPKLFPSVVQAFC